MKSFYQYVFLQHFVFTFDENRHLLFWDERALEQALYLAFGVDIKDAQLADQLRRKSDKADSLARNFNWQATEARRNLQILLDAVKPESNVEEDAVRLKELHRKMTEDADKAEARVQRLRSDISDTELSLATTSAEQTAVRSEYEAEYLVYIKSKGDVTRHPTVHEALTQSQCVICGSAGPAVTKTVQARISAAACPLCASPLAKGNSAGTKKLLELDKSLISLKQRLDQLLKKRGRLIQELQGAESDFVQQQSTLSKFEQENEGALKRVHSEESTSVDSAVQRYQAQIDELLKRKNDEYAKRNRAREDLRTLQRRLMAQYAEAETIFAPRFQDLAHLFLGIEIDIRPERTSSGLTLVLEVKSTVRRDTHQLSESQRFFVDIALRMALLQQMSNGPGGELLIDTPEGSLDIAYENRAGKMFAKFANDDYGLIITANINTSRLLQALAEQCGETAMTICRMTSWTDLSDVQLEEDALFEHAYADLQTALRKHLNARRGRPRV